MSELLHNNCNSDTATCSSGCESDGECRCQSGIDSEDVTSNDEMTSSNPIDSATPLPGSTASTTGCTSHDTLHPDISSGDIGKVVNLKSMGYFLSDYEKDYLLKNSFVPCSGYQFPVRSISGINHRFQHNWLSKYNGLVFSESENGGFCKFCVLFAEPSPTVKVFGIIINKPLTNFKKASERLNDHFGSAKFHKAAVEKARLFTKVRNDCSLSIANQLSTLREQRVAENQLKLQSIIETIILCGRQGLALRGHRDDKIVSHHDDTESALNHGNFLALLEFRVLSGDKILENHLKSAKGNALYTSKVIQNELITICGNVVRDKILQDIRSASYFSVIADEATDSTNVEQLSICIRYWCEEAPTEKFVGFVKCDTGVTGEAIADNILAQLNNWQLPPDLLRGQGYDGAGSMSGKTKGVAARIARQYPKAPFLCIGSIYVLLNVVAIVK